MEGTARIWFTSQQRAELWERWKNGQCVADIARALARRNKSGVYRILALNGGIAPEPRRRAAGALSLEEREEISRVLPPVGRCGGSHKAFDDRPRLSVGRLGAMAAAAPMRGRGRSARLGAGVAPEALSPGSPTGGIFVYLTAR